MRQLGTLPDAAQATRLTDYLVAKGMHIQCEPAGDKYAVWVRNEDHLAAAKQEFEKFLADPANERYDGNTEAAEEVRRQRQEKLDQARNNLVDARNLWTQPAFDQIPVTVVLIGLCIAGTFATNFGTAQEVVAEGLDVRIEPQQGMEWLAFYRISHAFEEEKPNSAFVDILRGEVWRLVTPAFIHFSWLHLIFNAAMLYQLGGLIEQRHGSLFMVVLSLFAAALSNVGNQLIDPGMIGGYSGVDYAYFGFVDSLGPVAWSRLSHGWPDGDHHVGLAGVRILRNVGIDDGAKNGELGSPVWDDGRHRRSVCPSGLEEPGGKVEAVVAATCRHAGGKMPPVVGQGLPCRFMSHAKIRQGKELTYLYIFPSFAHKSAVRVL